MREALTSFEAELDKLLRFLDASDAEDALVTALLARSQEDRAGLDDVLKAIQANSTIKRRQGYVSSIIVLYGALERFVEEAVAEYAASLVEIYQEFQKLPESLRDRHTKLTIEYLASLKDGKVRETEKIDAVIGTLHDCLNGTTPFRLNARAFSLRSSNMSLKRIREILGNLDVSLGGKRILLSPSYRGFLENSLEISPKEMKDGEVEATLEHVNELVGIRNDIAHGVANLESFEDNDLVRERATKLKAFVASLNEILECELINSRIALGQLVAIQGEIIVFGDNIACFAWPEGRIAPGDVLVMRPADDGADLRHGAVESIQIDKADQVEVHGAEGLMIGVRVPFKVKNNGTFFVLATTQES